MLFCFKTTLISRQPSKAAAAWSSSVPDFRVHDQPSPIFCQSTAPPLQIHHECDQGAEGCLFTDFPFRTLHKLEDADRPTLIPTAQRQTKCGRRLSLHRPGVHDRKWSIASLARSQTIQVDLLRLSLWHQAALPFREACTIETNCSAPSSPS